jgi:hypothetical protein
MEEKSMFLWKKNPCFYGRKIHVFMEKWKNNIYNYHNYDTIKIKKE